MASTLADLRIAVRAELGGAGDDTTLLTDAQIDRWVNEGQARLAVYKQQTSALSWTDDDTTIALPADFHHEEELVYDVDSDPLPPFRYWNGEILVRVPTDIEAGGGQLLYWSEYPAITGSVSSELNALGDNGLVLFAAHRFYKRLAGGRADYRRYATITQANGVGVNELDALSERYLADFAEVRDALQQQTPEATSFFFQG